MCRYHRVVEGDGVMSSKGGESVGAPGECLCEPVASDTDVFLSSLHVEVNEVAEMNGNKKSAFVRGCE
jgi:hypothetical protein